MIKICFYLYLYIFCCKNEKLWANLCLHSKEIDCWKNSFRTGWLSFLVLSSKTETFSISSFYHSLFFYSILGLFAIGYRRFTFHILIQQHYQYFWLADIAIQAVLLILTLLIYVNMLFIKILWKGYCIIFFS